MGEFDQVRILDAILLVLIAVTALAVVLHRRMFAVIMFAGLYSLFMASVWSNMHALDVAFTEAAVGAGISTILLLGAVVRIGRHVDPRPRLHAPALLVCGGVGALLIYGTLDMPRLGDPEAPIHTLRSPGFLEQNVGKMADRPGTPLAEPIPSADHPTDDFNGHSPNTVTSLLAAYRGYDTMFETAVILTAGVSLLLLLRPLPNRQKDAAS